MIGTQFETARLGYNRCNLRQHKSAEEARLLGVLQLMSILRSRLTSAANQWNFEFRFLAFFFLDRLLSFLLFFFLLSVLLAILCLEGSARANGVSTT